MAKDITGTVFAVIQIGLNFASSGLRYKFKSTHFQSHTFDNISHMRFSRNYMKFMKNSERFCKGQYPQ